MMLVGFLGCYGAIQESQCLLGTVSIPASWSSIFSIQNICLFKQQLHTNESDELYVLTSSL